MSATPLSEQRASVAGLEVFWRSAPTPDGRAAPLYLHGVPTCSDDWLPFLARTGGVAVDLPGFGRSDKPADFDYSIEGYAEFLRAFVDAAGLDRFALVTHDWGSVGLALAQDVPERVDRLVALNGVVGLRGYEWHRLARLWRRPLLGEMAMGFTLRFVMRALLRESNVTEGSLPPEMVAYAYEHFDHGTQRAILKLYRSAPEESLEAAGDRLGELTCPALVIHAMRDPYIGPRHSRDLADRLGGEVRVEELPDAGHWPWVGDRPDVIDTVADFLMT